MRFPKNHFHLSGSTTSRQIGHVLRTLSLKMFEYFFVYFGKLLPLQNTASMKELATLRLGNQLFWPKKCQTNWTFYALHFSNFTKRDFL